MAKRSEDSIHSPDPRPHHVDLEQAGQGLEQRIAVLVAAEEAAHDVDRLASAAVHDLREPAVGTGHDEVVGTDRPHRLRAADQMRIVARQQHGFAGAHLERLAAVEPDLHAAGDHIVVGDDLHRVGQQRPAVLGRRVSRDAPGRREPRVQEHAAGQADGLQHVGKGVHAMLPGSACR